MKGQNDYRENAQGSGHTIDTDGWTKEGSEKEQIDLVKTDEHKQARSRRTIA